MEKTMKRPKIIFGYDHTDPEKNLYIVYTGPPFCTACIPENEKIPHKKLEKISEKILAAYKEWREENNNDRIH